MRIARQNANMPAAMRGVMGGGERGQNLHEHRGQGAHSHPDAWDENDNASHTHKALRKAGSSGEWSAMRPGPNDPDRFSNRAGSGRKPVEHGHSANDRHSHAGGEMEHDHQYTTQPQYHKALRKAVRLAVKAVVEKGDPEVSPREDLGSGWRKRTHQMPSTGKNYHVLEHTKSGRVDYPVHYPTGGVGYDRPEGIPKRVRSRYERGGPPNAQKAVMPPAEMPEMNVEQPPISSPKSRRTAIAGIAHTTGRDQPRSSKNPERWNDPHGSS